MPTRFSTSHLQLHLQRDTIRKDTHRGVRTGSSAGILQNRTGPRWYGPNNPHSSYEPRRSVSVWACHSHLADNICTDEFSARFRWGQGVGVCDIITRHHLSLSRWGEMSLNNVDIWSYRLFLHLAWKSNATYVTCGLSYSFTCDDVSSYVHDVIMTHSSHPHIIDTRSFTTRPRSPYATSSLRH